VKLLLDENISYRLVRTLDQVFPGTVHVTDIPGLKGDRTIWEYAKAKGFMLVTFDTDFVQIAALRGAPPKILLLTLRNPRHAAIASLLMMRKEQIERFVEDMEKGSPAVMELA
jgi:predicted nuclease of predicted toxin-antitoxin system